MKKFLIYSVVIMGAIIIGLIITISMLDLNQYKPKLAQAVKSASGYDLKIDGDIKVSFSPVGLSLEGVKLSVPNKKEFVNFQKFGVALEIMPLLKNEVKVKYIVLSDLNLNIIKDKNGKFNFEARSDQGSTEKKAQSTEAKKTQNDKEVKIPLVNVNEIKIQNANIKYFDQLTNSKASLKNININVNDINFDSTKTGLSAIALNADVSIDKLNYNLYNINNINLKLGLRNAVANLKSMKYTIFNSNATGSAKLDMRSKLAKVNFSQIIPNLKLENFSKEILQKDLLKGIANLKTEISFKGLEERSAKKTLNGYLLLDGRDVGLQGFDIDKIVKNYENLKSGDLKKAGFSFLNSALEGKAKGEDPLKSLKGGTTAIKHLHVKIDIKNGIAKFSDVALSSLNNRVAIKGGVNLANEKLLGVKIAVLDKKGCAKFSQTISGTITNPKANSMISSSKTDKISVEQVEQVVGIISSFFGKNKKKEKPKKVQNKCTKPFYNGAVK